MTISNYIDDITWNNLDIDKIYKRLNVCLTSCGEEYLYEILHKPHFSNEELEEREKFIKYLNENPEIRLKLQIILSKTGKQNDIDLLYFCMKQIKKL